MQHEPALYIDRNKLKEKCYGKNVSQWVVKVQHRSKHKSFKGGRYMVS